MGTPPSARGNTPDPARRARATQERRPDRVAVSIMLSRKLASETAARQPHKACVESDQWRPDSVTPGWDVGDIYSHAHGTQRFRVVVM